MWLPLQSGGNQCKSLFLPFLTLQATMLYRPRAQEIVGTENLWSALLYPCHPPRKLAKVASPDSVLEGLAHTDKNRLWFYDYCVFYLAVSDLISMFNSTFNFNHIFRILMYHTCRSYAECQPLTPWEWNVSRWHKIAGMAEPMHQVHEWRFAGAMIRCKGMYYLTTVWLFG
jgi:hypothetical protein